MIEKCTINECTELSINLRIHSFKSEHSENQLIASKESDKKDFLMLNASKNELENNNTIDVM